MSGHSHGITDMGLVKLRYVRRCYDGYSACQHLSWNAMARFFNRLHGTVCMDVPFFLSLSSSSAVGPRSNKKVIQLG